MSAISLAYTETMFIAYAIPTHQKPPDLEGDLATEFSTPRFAANTLFQPTTWSHLFSSR